MTGGKRANVQDEVENACAGALAMDHEEGGLKTSMTDVLKQRVKKKGQECNEMVGPKSL